MARRKGSLDLDAAVELGYAGPLDAKQLVRTKEEQLDPASFEYGYKGLLTVNRDEEKLYLLSDHQNPTQETSWKVIGPYDDSALDARVTALENASPSEQVQADWNETDTTSKAFIQNKPTIPEAYDDSTLAARVTALENAPSTAPTWNDVTGKPEFANVATSGSYNDLGDKPTIPEAYDDTEVRNLIAGKANSADLAPVATSGSYNDLGDKPTIPEAYDDTALAGRVSTLEAKTETQADWNETDTDSAAYIANKPTIPEAYDDTALAGRVTAVETALPGKADSSSLATVATSGSYNDLTDKPTISEAYDDTAIQTALADRYTKAETDGKIAEAIDDVNVEHFHTVTTLPPVAEALENHEYVLVTYEQDGTTIASEEHYLFYNGVFHSRPTKISLDGYATEQYVNNALPTIDTAMSDTSENPVQNKVVLAAIGDAVDVVDTAVQGLDTRVTAVEEALNLTALTDEEIAALVPA